MLPIILIVLFGLLGIACLIGRKVTDDDDAKVAGVIGGFVFIGLAIIVLLFSSVTIVSTKNIGVKTSFGKTTGYLDNGLHITAPWVDVTEMDAAIQTDSYTNHQCINVRIANQQVACVSLSIQWRLRPGAVDSLFKNYRSFENVRDYLVTRNLHAAINAQLASYNALNGVTGAGSAQTPNPTLAQIGDSVSKQMRSEIGSQIEVLKTIIPFMSFDSKTQGRLNQLNQQEALTRVAEAAQGTAQAQAVANQDLAASVSNDPNVLVAECINGPLKTMADAGTVPAGFSCWSGNGVAAVIAKG